MVDSVRRTLGQSVVYASNGSVLDLLHFPFIPLTSSVPRAIEFAKQMEALAKETSAALTFAAEANKTIWPKALSAEELSVGDLVLLEAKGLEATRPSKKLDDNDTDRFK